MLPPVPRHRELREGVYGTSLFLPPTHLPLAHRSAFYSSPSPPPTHPPTHPPTPQGLDVASAFEVLEPLSPHSNAIFTNFPTEPTIRLLLAPTPRQEGEEGEEKKTKKVLTFSEREEEIPAGRGRGGGGREGLVGGA